MSLWTKVVMKLRKPRVLGQSEGLIHDEVEAVATGQASGGWPGQGHAAETGLQPSLEVASAAFTNLSLNEQQQQQLQQQQQQQQQQAGGGAAGAMDASSLRHVEHLCEVLYNSTNEQDRQSAQQQLLSLQSSAEYIPQCQYILDNSKSPYALFVASSALTRLITQYWNNFSVSERMDIRNYILSYLAASGPQLPDFVATSLIQLVCRITKLGWFDEAQHRDLVDEVTKFLQATVDYCIIGLKILNHLVDEFNLPTSGRTLTQHRKTAVSFRDLSLFKVYQIALTTLRQLQLQQISATPEQSAKMAEQSLSLSTRCLSFDFIGTNPDESAEDVGTIQVPNTWRQAVQDPSTMQLYLDFYKSTEPPSSSEALQSIILLSSVRRSLFATDKERAQFLQHLVTAIREILTTEQGLNRQENYHEFCRLLGRLKANYQLCELVRTDGFDEWLELAANFTVKSFQQWQWFANSIHYLLALWGRLIAAIPYVPQANGGSNYRDNMQRCVLQVVQSYIKCMIESVEVIVQSEHSIDDPLDDDGSLKEQLERLPVICLFQYPNVAQFLLSFLDPILRTYEEQVLKTPNPPQGQEALRRVEVLDGQLTWLVYIIGAIIGGHSSTDLHGTEGQEAIDAQMASRCLQLAGGVNYRMSQTGGRAKCSHRLELAILYFFQNFRKMYTWEQHMPGMLSVSSVVRMDSGPMLKQKAYQTMYEHMGMGDHVAITNIMVTKMGNNLKYWGGNEEVISKTLQLFLEMTMGCGSSKVLLSLETVQYLLTHHTPHHFPFLSLPANSRHRTSFHATLARLILSVTDDMANTFDAFMEPILQVLSQLLSTPNLRSDEAKQAIVGVCRDLRGVTSATQNRKSYTQLFELLYPQYFPVFVKTAETWFDSPDVMTALLKFLQEFVYNKAQRLMFDQNSANGILLFREASKILVAYGSRALQHPLPPGAEVYKAKYKGIAISLNVLTCALSGSYVNFGVFSLYEDPALESALDVCLRLALSIPFQEILAFPKLSKAYFAFFEVLFRNHISAVLSLSTPIFLQVIQALHEGLQSVDTLLSAQCASTIDYLATYYFQNRNKDRPAIHSLRQHLLAQPDLILTLLSTLFSQLLFGAINHWAISRPILSLMLASEDDFNNFKEHMIQTQSPENQAKLCEEFNRLLTDLQRNLESSNRERFGQKLTIFRLNVHQFLTL